LIDSSYKDKEKQQVSPPLRTFFTNEWDTTHTGKTKEIAKWKAAYRHNVSKKSHYNEDGPTKANPKVDQETGQLHASSCRVHRGVVLKGTSIVTNA